MADDTPEGDRRIADLLPWRLRSRQQEGRVTERRILRKMGAVAHSNSGAGHIKDDGHTDDLLIEIKDARKLYTLHADELEATHMRALQQDRRGVWFIFFSDRNWTAEVRLIPGGKELLG